MNFDDQKLIEINPFICIVTLCRGQNICSHYIVVDKQILKLMGFSLDESALLAEAFLNLFQSLMLTHEGQCPVRCVDWKLKHTLFSQKT